MKYIVLEKKDFANFWPCQNLEDAILVVRSIGKECYIYEIVSCLSAHFVDGKLFIE